MAIDLRPSTRTGNFPPIWRSTGGPMITAIAGDLASGVEPGLISRRFHNTLAETIIDIAGRIGNGRVLLTGGCFQNKYLAERTIARLMESGFTPYWHRNIPPNDGGIAPGQVYCAMLTERAR